MYIMTAYEHGYWVDRFRKWPFFPTFSSVTMLTYWVGPKTSKMC